MWQKVRLLCPKYQVGIFIVLPDIREVQGKEEQEEFKTMEKGSKNKKNFRRSARQNEW
jgi:hypothetical protein